MRQSCLPLSHFSVFGARVVAHQDQKDDEGSGALEPQNDFQRQQVNMHGDDFLVVLRQRGVYLPLY
jgi:hypothetical protein